MRRCHILLSLVVLWPGLWGLCQDARAESIPLCWNRASVRLTREDRGMLAVRMQDAVPFADPGNPDLPWVMVQTVVPSGSAVAGWAWLSTRSEVLASDVTPVPASRDQPIGSRGPELSVSGRHHVDADSPPAKRGGQIQSEPNRLIYGGFTPYPAECVSFRGVQGQNGVAIATFLLCPFRWDPQSRILTWSPGGTLEIQISPGERPSRFLPPPRQTPWNALVDSPASPKVGGSATRSSSAAPLGLAGDLKVSERPDTSSIPVEYLIITSDQLETAYAPLLDWKNRTGHPAVCRTVSWISRNYPTGTDSPEKIRLFIRDAYLHWGVRTVLLGGDHTHVPLRYARSYAYSAYGTDIAADAYFACLDGNWNADGDGVFGEGGRGAADDHADLRPEIKIGRLPAATPEQVQLYLDKYLRYVREPDLGSGYLSSILTMGEVLFDPDWRVGDADTCSADPSTRCVKTDGATLCFAAMDSLSSSPWGGSFRFDQLYEREYWWNQPQHRPWPADWPPSRQLTQASALASINDGRNLIFMAGHGDANAWGIGLGRLYLSEVRNLRNSPRFSGLIFTTSCSTASLDRESMGQAWLLGSPGGGLTYLGTTDLGFVPSGLLYQNLFCHAWFSGPASTPGDAAREAAAMLGSWAGDWDGLPRFEFYSRILLGDPDLRVWKSTPRPLSVTAPDTVTLGDRPIPVTVSVDGSPLEGALVCLYKANDALAIGSTDATGACNLPFAPGSTGEFSIAVTHPGALPYEARGTVRTPPSAAFASMLRGDLLDDGTSGTFGNGNAEIETGETVAIRTTCRNSGPGAARNLSAHLQVGGAVPGITVSLLDSTAIVTELAPEGTSTLDPAFRLRVSHAGSGFGLPDSADLNLPLVLEWQWDNPDGPPSASHQTLTIPVHQPDLLLVETGVTELALNPGDPPDSLPDAGETIGLAIRLYNRGRGTWSRLRCRLEATPPGSVEMIDSLVSVPALPPGQSGLSDTLRFRVIATGDLSVRWTLEDTLRDQEPERIAERALFLSRRPGTPSRVLPSGTPHSVTLTWETPAAPAGVWGYAVRRADTVEGPYHPVGTGFVLGMRRLTDEPLPPLRRFYYQVAVIDSSGLESRPTPPVAGVTSPGTLPGWPQFIQTHLPDVAPTIANLDGTGVLEVLCGAERLYAFGAAGTDYGDGDHNPITRGVLVSDDVGSSFLAKSTVCDLDGDRKSEIIAMATNGTNGGWDPPAQLIVLDHLGQLQWARTVTDRPVSSTPAVGDIDADGNQEIVFLAGRWLFAFNGDGTAFHGVTDGKLFESLTADYQYASVALANLDSDAAEEIVFGTSSHTGSDAALHVINGIDDQGTLAGEVEGFPFAYGSVVPGSQFSHCSPAIGDLTSRDANGTSGNPDGRPDIVIKTRSEIWVFDPWATGANKLVWNFQVDPAGGEENPLTSSPALGDIDGDGDLDIAVGGAFGRLYVLNGRGEVLPGFSDGPEEPYRTIGTRESRLGSPILANIDNDARPEIIVGDNMGHVHAIRHDGSIMGGFPYQIPEGRIGQGLAAWDIDRDGCQNLVIQPAGSTSVVVLDFPGSPFHPENPSENPWPQFRRDARNTGAMSGGEIITPVLTLALEARTVGPLEVELRWECTYAVSTFSLLRRLAPEAASGPAAAPGPVADWEPVGAWDTDQVRESPDRFHVKDQVSEAGIWRYRVEAKGATGAILLSGETTVNVGGSPRIFRLLSPQPNPSSGTVRIVCNLPSQGLYEIMVVTVGGRLMRRLFRGPAGPGQLELRWSGDAEDGSVAPPGVYFVRASLDDRKQTARKFILLPPAGR